MSLEPCVPEERWPKPITTRELAPCGLAGRLIENTYSGKELPYGLFEQSGHAGAAILIADTPEGKKVALVEEWRPSDKASLHVPAGDIGLGSSRELLSNMLREIREEVGKVEILEISAGHGFNHNPSREVVAGGGPKNFFPFLIRVSSPVDSKIFHQGDEKTKSLWYSEEEVREMVRSGRIRDMATCFFLLIAGIIKVEDFGWEKVG